MKRALVISTVCFWSMAIFAIKPSLAASCDDVATIGLGIQTGDTQNGVTKRCLGIDGNTGLSITCDFNERAASSSCIWIRTNDAVSSETYLLSAGRVTHRSAGCLWSGSVKAAIVVFCKAIGPRRGGEKGSVWDGLSKLD